MRNIKLMTDYGCFPIWDRDNICNLNPENLPISENLKQALQKWADIYDETLDPDDPASAGFESEETEESFEKMGLRLWRQLEDELGAEYSVQYFSTTENRLL